MGKVKSATERLIKILSVTAVRSFRLNVPSKIALLFLRSLLLSGNAITSIPRVEKSDSIKPTS